MNDEMYKENILEHYHNPLNKGRLDNANCRASINNTLCGDVIQVQLLVEKSRIKDIRFSGEGCAISQASASMLTEKVKGMPIADVLQLRASDVLSLLQISLSPTRMKCGLLPLMAIQQAITFK